MNARFALSEQAIEIVQRAFQCFFVFFGNRFIVDNCRHDFGITLRHEVQQFGFVATGVFERDAIHITVGRRIDNQNLIFQRHRFIVLLLQNLGQSLAARQLRLRALVQIGSELRKRGEFAKTRQVEFEATRDLLHRFELRRRTDARHAQTGVNRGTLTRIEQVGFEEDLTVGNRNHIGRNISGNVVRLRFDNRQRGQRTAAQIAVHFGATLEQARMQVEHVARIGFSAWRTAQQQTHRAIRDGVLRQIIVNDQGVFAVVAEIFAHRGSGIRRDVLQRGGIVGARHNHNRVLHRAAFFQLRHQSRNRALLLANRDIDAENAGRALIDNRVNRNTGFSGLAVADNQFALAATDGNHRVDSFDAGHQRLFNAFALHHTRRFDFDKTTFS